MKQENIKYARELISSITTALDKAEAESQAEGDYLHEKVTKLHDLVIEECK